MGTAKPKMLADRLQTAARTLAREAAAHAFIGGARPEDWPEIERRFKAAKARMTRLVQEVSELETELAKLRLQANPFPNETYATRL